jgi:hypothetical protein
LPLAKLFEFGVKKPYYGVEGAIVLLYFNPLKKG